MVSAGMRAIALGLLGASLGVAKSEWGAACSNNNTHLDSNTWALDTDCDAMTYCADNSTCAWRGCRSDVYPYGYNGVPYDQYPPMCPDGQFCPDEGSHCIPQVAVGGGCQKDRDDECQPPPNMNQLAGFLNVNGSVCLNFECYYANVTAGAPCVLENTVYNAYAQDGDLYSYIISRDNCANGFWCDASSQVCQKGKNLGATCTGNKECISYNCKGDGTCGSAADEPIHPATWVYAVIGVGIVLLVVGVMTALWLAHRRSRNENQIKLEQYYNEQLAYRQSILSMSQARNSLMIGSQGPRVTAGGGGLNSPGQLGVGGASSGYDLDLPPNMCRESSQYGFSDAGDSEVLLSGDAIEPNQAPRWRRP